MTINANIAALSAHLGTIFGTLRDTLQADTAAASASAITAGNAATGAQQAADAAAQDASSALAAVSTLGVEAVKALNADTRTLTQITDAFGTTGEATINIGGMPYTVDLTQSSTPFLVTGSGLKVQPKPIGGSVFAAQCNLNGGSDETTGLITWLQWATDNGYTFDLGGRALEISKMTIVGDTKLRNGSIKSNKTVPDGSSFQADIAFEFTGEVVGEIDVTQDISVGTKRLQLASTSIIEPGYILRLQSSRLIDTDNRGAWREGQMLRVVDVIDATDVRIEKSVCYAGRANTFVTGTVTGFDLDRYQIDLSNTLAGNGRDSQCEITITSGAAAGERRFVLARSGTNNLQHRHAGYLAGEWDRGPWPAGVQVGDTYTYAWKSIVDVFKPATVELDRMLFTRDHKIDFNANDFGFRGVRLQYTSMSKVTNCRIEKFNETGIHLSQSYAPLVDNLEVYGANLSHSLFGGTGYGVSVETCSNPRIHNVHGSNCRRVVDLSGAGGYTEHGEVINVVGIGGGLTYEGFSYWPGGNQQQTVVGSHGSGRFSRYINCMGIDCYGGLNLRGREEIAYNYSQFGACNTVVNINYCSGSTIDGVVYSDEYSEQDRSADFRHVVGSVDNSKRPDQVVFIDFSDPFAGRVTTTVRNVRAKAIAKYGVVLSGTGADLRNLVFEDWHLTVSNEGTALTEFQYIAHSSTATMDNCFFNNLLVTVAAGDTATTKPFLLGVPGTIEPKVGGKIMVDGIWYFRLDQGQIARIPVGSSTAMVDMCNVRTGARPYIINAILQDSTGGTVNAAPDKSKVDIVSTYPTGTAGVTAGNFGINLSLANQAISVVNNAGNTQTFRIQVR
jgi:hypothetical protein